MEPLTIAGIVSALILKVFEKSGEKLGEALVDKIRQLINAVREKFKPAGLEGILTQIEGHPTEANRQVFQTVLEIQASQDQAFAKKLETIVNELQSSDQISQIFLKDIDVGSSVEIKDINQIATSGRTINQEAATNLRVSGDLKIGNVNQQS